MIDSLAQRLEKLYVGHHFTVGEMSDPYTFETIGHVVIIDPTGSPKDHKIVWSIEAQMDLTALMGKEAEETLFSLISNEVFKILMKMKVE
jgi:hypothetical protein